MYYAWDFVVFEEAMDISPQVPSIILVIMFGTSHKFIAFSQIVYLLQADLSSKESQVTNLRENIKSQQAETSKAKDELTNALAAMKKLKESFKAKEKGWDIDRSALLKRAEDAEAALKPVTEELSGLKQHINLMSAAIFGKNRLPLYL